MSATKPLVVFEGPPGDQICAYHRNVHASQQPTVIPPVLRHAMAVREAVFVIEQKNVLLPHHMDPDDARSCHWVAYEYPEGQSTLGISPIQPIGTIRLVPYPHVPHPVPGASYEAPGEDAPVEGSETFFRRPPPEYRADRATSLHDGQEPYLKLGRLCVIKDRRGKKLGDALIQAALNWASENPHFWRKAGIPEWNGLVCAHAQEKAVTTWQRNGFVIDEEMGSWNTVGVRHYGLFHRVNIKS